MDKLRRCGRFRAVGMVHLDSYLMPGQRLAAGNGEPVL